MVLGGYVGPLAVLFLGVLPSAIVAGVARRLFRASLLLTLPIAISLLLVNTFFFPGASHVLFAVGPLRATREGLFFAGEVLVRLFAFSTAIGLFLLTTDPRALVHDLQRRGLSARLAFVVAATLGAVPQMGERAAAIAAVQRARGLDTEGGLGARLRGVLPLVGPVLFGSLSEVEERTQALEARGFSRPGRRDLLWAPPDSPHERVLRWALLLGLVALIGARLTGPPD